MAFFDTTPLGRVLARFSKDQNTLDMKLPESMNTLFYCLLDVCSTLALVATISPVFAIGLGPIAYGYYVLQRYYATTARELKRLDSLSRSPLYAFFAETLNGTESIRAYGRQRYFLDATAAHVDNINCVQQARSTLSHAARAGGFRTH